MKVTFPYMGNTLLYAKLFELLGHEVIIPPRPGRKTVDLGVKYSPEFACFPLKVLLGSYLEAIEKGADTVITSGGHGPCRAGYYGEVHKKILHDMGKDIDFIIFDEPKYNWKKFIHNIRKAKADSSWLDIIFSFKTAYQMASSLDSMQKIVERRRPYVRNKIKFNNSWSKIKEDYGKIKKSKEIKKVQQQAKDILFSYQVDKPAPEERLKVGVIGEIYVVMEESVNKSIVSLLNDYGVEVELSHYISSWVDNHLLPFKGKKGKEIMDKGEKYIEIVIGGHAKQNIGHIIDFKERGFDGIIHLKPFGCLPEIITQSIIDKVSDDFDIPVLCFSIDEQTARANMLTRVEAFLDMIKKRKFDRERKVSSG